MEKYLKVLKKCPLFLEIEEKSLLRMLVCLGAKTKTFDKKNSIIDEGDPARNIAILLSGKANVIGIDYYGNRNIISRVLPSDIISEDFACAEVDSVPITVVAEDICEVMFIDCSHIMHTCQNNCGFHGQMIFNLMKNLAKKSVSFQEKIEITSKRTTREKLLAYLEIESKKAGKRTFEIPFDRQELSDYLEVNRSGLSAEISKLRDEGVLESHKRSFKLL